MKSNEKNGKEWGYGKAWNNMEKHKQAMKTIEKYRKTFEIIKKQKNEKALNIMKKQWQT